MLVAVIVIGGVFGLWRVYALLQLGRRQTARLCVRYDLTVRRQWLVLLAVVQAVQKVDDETWSNKRHQVTYRK